jgi:hypothetical protein
MSRPRFPDRAKLLRAPAAILLLALLTQLGLLLLTGSPTAPATRPLSGDEKRYVEVATLWAAGEPAELDPLWPPGYPAVVALVLACDGSLVWVVGLQIAALFVAGWLLGRIVLEVGGSPAIAMLAASILLIDPEVAAFAWLYRPEALHLAAMLAVLLLAIRNSGHGRAERRPRELVLLGASLGGAIALKSLLLPLVPLVLGAVMVGRERSSAPSSSERRWRTGLVRGALMAAPLAAVLAPVLAYEHAANGVWTLGASARFNLWVGLTDRSPRSLAEDRTWEEYLAFRAGGATFAERQAALGRKLGELVSSRGLPTLVAGQWPRQAQRLFDRESYFSAALPPEGSRYLAGEGYRDAPEGLARLLGALEVGLYVVILAAAPFGLACLVRERRAGAFWIVALLAYQLGLFWFVHVKSRYRLTLLPLLVLGAVWSVEVLRRRGEGGKPRPSAAEFALGAGGAALLLYCAFSVG